MTRWALNVSPPQTSETSWKSLRSDSWKEREDGEDDDDDGDDWDGDVDDDVKKGVRRAPFKIKPVTSQIVMSPHYVVLEVVPFQTELILLRHIVIFPLGS